MRGTNININTMTPKLYAVAYRFLKARANKGNFEALQTLNKVTDQERGTIIKFLSFQHCVKFI